MTEQSSEGYIKGGILPGKLEHHLDMDAMAEVLATKVGRPVVNMTGLAGPFDVRLRWDPASDSAAGASTRPSLYTALEEQLGLKLSPRKAQLDLIVIVHVEKPSANQSPAASETLRRGAAGWPPIEI